MIELRILHGKIKITSNNDCIVETIEISIGELPKLTLLLDNCHLRNVGQISRRKQSTIGVTGQHRLTSRSVKASSFVPEI